MTQFQHGRPPRWAIVEGVTLLVLVMLMFKGFTASVDLHTTDDANYHRLGRSLLDGVVTNTTLIWSPVYATVYGLFDRAWDSQTMGFLQDFFAVGITIAALATMWWTLRAMLSASASFLAVAWWATASPFVLRSTQPHTSVYLFTAVLYLFAIGCFARRWHATGLVALCLAAINRLELIPWLMGVAVYFAWRGRGGTRRWAFSAVLLATALILQTSMSTAGRSRSFFAFSQNFAFGWSQRAEDFSRDPLIYHEEITSQSFHDATSIGGALLDNPTAFAEHLWHNVEELRFTLGMTFFDPMPHVALVSWALVAAVLLLATLGILRPRPPTWSEPPPIPSELRWVLLLSLLCTPALILLLPKVVLLLPTLVLVTIPVARLVARGCAALRVRLPAVVPALAVLATALLVPRPFPSNRARPQPARESVALVAEAARAAPIPRLIASDPDSLILLAGAEPNSTKCVVLSGDGVASAVAESAPGDMLLMTYADPFVHGKGLQPLFDSLFRGQWSLTQSGLSCWAFVRNDR
jgi:hypothetical protein